MLQQREPRDYVIATGEMHSVREVCELAFARAGLAWSDHVRTDPAFHRPAEVHLLCGDASRAREELGNLIREMVDADLERERVS
jgi:GDPmannose 4,6-dehydratase